MERIECKDRTVRGRAVELISRVLSLAPPGAVLPEGLFEALTPRLLARASDKHPAVRASALRALERLQEGEPAAAAAVAAALTQDTAAEVRAAAAGAVLLGDQGTLTALVQRATRDASSAVRTAALTRLRHAAPWQALPPAHRRALAAWGAVCPTPAERAAASLLCATWLSACEWDLLSLVEGFDVVGA